MFLARHLVGVNGFLRCGQIGGNRVDRLRGFSTIGFDGLLSLSQIGRDFVNHLRIFSAQGC